MRRHSLHAVLTPAAAGLLAAGALMAVPSAARATASDCPPSTEEVCVWSAADYTGQLTVLQDESCHNGQVGSAVNNDPDTTQDLRVFPQPGCGGQPAVVGPGRRSPSVGGQSYENWHSPSSPAVIAR